LFCLSKSSDIVLSSILGLCLLFVFIPSCIQLRILARTCQEHSGEYYMLEKG
jgi:hypothetical protein